MPTVCGDIYFVVFFSHLTSALQSKNSFDDPKVESIAELFRRRTGGPVGMVSTAFIADATPGVYIMLRTSCDII
jgi:hypothetical protein